MGGEDFEFGVKGTCQLVFILLCITVLILGLISDQQYDFQFSGFILHKENQTSGRDFVKARAPHSVNYLSTFMENKKCLEHQLLFAREGDMASAAGSTRSESVRPLALAIPLHPPNFGYFLNFLGQRDSDALGWDIFPIFTNTIEAGQFEDFMEKAGKSDLKDRYYPLLLSWDPSIKVRVDHFYSWNLKSAEGTPLSPPYVAYKNYHAMAILHACYDLISVPDSEIDLLSPGGLVGALRERVRSARVLGVRTPRYRYFNEWATCFFEACDILRLRMVSRDLELWSWWSDFPVIVAKDLPQFLAYAGYPRRFIQALGKEFVYLSYELWKVMRGDWIFEDVSLTTGYSTCGSLEMMKREEDYLAVVKAYPPGPRWLTRAFCDLHPQFCPRDDTNSSVVAIFHLDRGLEILDLVAGQSCEPMHFNKDPFLSEKWQSQSCKWFNNTEGPPEPISDESTVPQSLPTLPEFWRTSDKDPLFTWAEACQG